MYEYLDGFFAIAQAATNATSSAADAGTTADTATTIGTGLGGVGITVGSIIFWLRGLARKPDLEESQAKTQAALDAASKSQEEALAKMNERMVGIERDCKDLVQSHSVVDQTTGRKAWYTNNAEIVSEQKKTNTILERSEATSRETLNLTQDTLKVTTQTLEIMRTSNAGIEALGRKIDRSLDP